MAKRTVIAIDGLAGSGKSSLARELAKKLDYALLNSGLLYRAVGYLLLKANLDLSDPDSIKGFLKDHTIELSRANGEEIIKIDQQKVDIYQLQQSTVSEMTSKAACLQVVRDYLMDMQREAYSRQPLVAEGRDMGSVVFPDAAIKFFVTAELSDRVERRIKQLSANQNLSEERSKELKKQMEIEIVERDKRDTERAIAPTRAVEGAIMVNNSGQTLTQVVQYMYDSLASKGLV